MTKKQIVSGLLKISYQLDLANNFKDADLLMKVAKDIADDLTKEGELESNRKGNPKEPQDEQLEDARSGVSEDTHEVRLESKRNK